MRLHRHFRRRLRSLRGMTIVHVGAQDGRDAAAYRDHGADHVIFIEAELSRIEGLRTHCARIANAPRPRLSDILRLPRTRFTVLNAFIGDTEGKQIPFHRYASGGEAKSVPRKVKPNDDGLPGTDQTAADLPMTMRRLDSLLAEAGIPPSSVSALTLGVQGAELICLRGAPQALRAAQALAVGVANSAWHQGRALGDDVEPWLIERGFTRATMRRSNRVFQDVVFVRN